MDTDQVVADFRVNDQSHMYERLNAAVATAHAEGLADKIRGVLVTRHDFSRFNVTLSCDVPFGLVIERDHASRL
ncbi:hypothetical protein V3C33_07505 [Micrococcaceae bacterium Sec5.7]